MEENTTEIIIAVIGLIGIIIGGALFSINKSRKKNSKNTQENINITGDNNKVVGGDDNSKV